MVSTSTRHFCTVLLTSHQSYFLQPIILHCKIQSKPFQQMAVYGVSYISPRKDFWLLPHTLTFHKYAAIEYIYNLWGKKLGLHSPTEAEMSAFPSFHCSNFPLYTLCTYISDFFHMLRQVSLLLHMVVL